MKKITRKNHSLFCSLFCFLFKLPLASCFGVTKTTTSKIIKMCEENLRKASIPEITRSRKLKKLTDVVNLLHNYLNNFQTKTGKVEFEKCLTSKTDKALAKFLISKAAT